MNSAEPLTVDKCFATQDGWRVLAVQKSGAAATLSVPCEVQEGVTIYARRFGTQWSLVEPLELRSGNP